ncbi:MAG: hypothetical protein ACXW0T_11755 [Methylobacter sp.]
MLEIPPLSPARRIIKSRKIRKNDPLSKQPKRKKKEILEEQEAEPVQHIDETV